MGTKEEPLIDLIYDAAADSTRWHDVSSTLRRLTGATDSLLHTPFLSAQNGGLWSSAWPTSVMDAYGQYYRNKDPWIQNGMALNVFKVGNVVTGESLASDDEWCNSEWYNDVLRQFDVGRLSAALLSDPGADGSGAAVLCLFRPLRAEPFSAAVQAHVSAVVPHLQRAVRIDRQLRRSADKPGWSLAFVDQLDWGVFLLDGSSRIAHANPPAAEIVRSVDGLGIQAGFLKAALARENNDLRRAAMLAVVRGHGADLLISRPSGRRPYVITVVPLTRRTGEVSGDVSIRAAVHVVDSERVPRSNEARLAALFGLTAAEGRLAVALVGGATLATYGEERGVAISTVRTQLQSLFGKTGTNSQGTLIGVLSRSLLPIVPGG